MDEYIERKAALDALRKIRNPNYSSAQMRMMSMAKSEIIRLRAADVAPVRHGRWIDTEFYGPHRMMIVQCSVCKKESEGSLTDAYCPNCGAKMDQETEE